MRCPRCHHESETGAKFCEECAAPLVRVCAKCGRQLSPTAKFCPECAHPVAKAAPEQRFDSPEAYTPKHLADKILTSKSAIEGERKLVTVLFCDIANSTALAERVGPDAMHALLSSFFELALAEVHRYEGTINQFLGDGFMALFGAPVAHEDHARRAALAALEIRRALGARPLQLTIPLDVELSVRMGLNTGPVVVGCIGDNLRMDYTAIGDTTNLAARLQQQAEPGSILISEPTRQLVKGYVRDEPVPPIAVKGKTEPLTAFKVVGLGTRRSPLRQWEEDRLSRFVGRDRELVSLRDALTHAEAGRGQVIGIVGDPGVGKSRLLYEFRHSLERRPVTYLEGRCPSYGTAIPYLPLQEIIRDNCGINSTDTPGQVAEKIRVGLEQVAMDPEEGSPYLLQLLGVKEGTEGLAQIGPETIKARIFDTVRQMSLNGSRRRPLIFAVEDLHWIDKTSEEYFTSAVEGLAGAPILLLTTYRPGYKPPWIDKSYATQVALRPLSSQDSRLVVESVVERTTAISEPTAQDIIDKADGNPFFLEELTRVALERGRRGTNVTIPDTIQGVLAARIDRLPEEPKRVLQTAAVIGKDVPFTLLLAIAELTEEALRSGLTHLRAAEFLHETRLFPDSEYTFKHALTHEVAYESLLQERRRVLHAQVVNAIEQLYPDRLTEHVERLARHAVHGEVWGKAVAYAREAGLKAFARSANRDAVVMFEQALEALQQLPETRQTLEQAIDVRFELRSALLTLGDLERILERLHDADSIAARLDDPRRLGWVATYMTIHYILSADTEHSIAAGERAVASANRANDVGLLIVANSYLGTAYYDSGDYRRAVSRFRWSVETLPMSGRHERLGQATLPSVYSRALWALSAAQPGAFSEGAERTREAVQIAEEVGQPISLAFALFALGTLHIHKGDWLAAIEVLERGLELGRRSCQEVWKRDQAAAICSRRFTARTPLT